MPVINGVPTLGATGLAGTNYLDQIRTGLIPGKSARVVNGNNPSVGIASIETVWDVSGQNLVQLTSETELFVASTNAGDNQTILQAGLEGTYTSQIESATLTGTTPVSIGSWLRPEVTINTSATPLLGDVYLGYGSFTAGIPDDPAKILSKIIIGNETTRNGVFTVPAGKIAVPRNIAFYTGEGKDAKLSFVFTSFGGAGLVPQDFQIFQTLQEFDVSSNPTIPAKTDAVFRCISQQLSTPVSISAFVTFQDE